jgi:ribonuclease VapC
VVLDSSAIVAIEMEETGYQALVEKIGRAEAILIGAPTMFETAMVLTSRRKRDARSWLTGFLQSVGAESIAFSESHFHTAMEAFVRYGRGRHPASLSFGDCMSYAVARVAGMPLLYVGGDFAKTDIPAA